MALIFESLKTSPRGLIDLSFDELDLSIECQRALEDQVYLMVDKQVAVGLIHMIQEDGFMYIYIKAEYRTRGYGRQGFEWAYGQMPLGKRKKIMTTYRQADCVSKNIARHWGFKRQFSSTHMVYKGETFETEALSIRPYNHDDYDQAHGMYALAFHKMRMAVGDFPESKVAPKNDRTRNGWAQTSQYRYIYSQDQEILGYGHCRDGEIKSVAIGVDHHRKGHGRRFIKGLCNIILEEGYGQVNLSCVQGNPAMALYQALGFQTLDEADYAVRIEGEV